MTPEDYQTVKGSSRAGTTTGSNSNLCQAFTQLQNKQRMFDLLPYHMHDFPDGHCTTAQFIASQIKDNLCFLPIAVSRVLQYSYMLSMIQGQLLLLATYKTSRILQHMYSWSNEGMPGDQAVCPCINISVPVSIVSMLRSKGRLK